MKNPVTAFVVNTFADEDFPGSPTGVVPDARGLDEAMMVRLTKALGVSHAAFLNGPGKPAEECAIRFFTQNGEIKNCAHATIAAHFFLASRTDNPEKYAAQQSTDTGSQSVHVRMKDGTGLVFFQQSPVSGAEPRADDTPALLRILGLEEKDLSGGFGIRLASPGTFRYMVPVGSVEKLLSLTPDFPALSSFCSERDLLGCFAFTLEGGTSGWTAHARMFAPAIGVPEDRINGNSAGCLGAYIIESVEGASDAIFLTVFQGHHFDGPGRVFVEAVRSDSGIDTLVGGTAEIKDRREFVF